jgi:uncharacterized damage-inducible protein DinB
MGAKADLLETSTYVAARSLERLQGLTDEEALWEPVPRCWSVRQREDGTWHGEGASMPAHPRFTTIGWRLWHLTACYGEVRNARWFGFDATPAGFEHDDPIPAAAAAQVERLAAAQRWWHDVLERVDDELLAEPVGPIGGPYAEATKGAFVLHQLDEQIHHAAEIGVVRDLYRWSTQPYEPTFVEAVRDGERELVLSLLEDPSLVIDARSDEPIRGATALHHACAVGDPVVVQALLDRGADPTVRDEVYGADARGWATYFGQTKVQALLPPS